MNVATARNDISFIVPARFLTKMIQSNNQQPLATEEALKAEVKSSAYPVRKRLYRRHYRKQMVDLAAWRKLTLPGVISPTVRCWDNSAKLNTNALYKRFQIRCANKNNVYLDDTNQFVGDLSYEYYWLESDQLDSIRFHNLYEKLNKDQIDTRLDEEVVSNFNCDTWFVHIATQEFKTQPLPSRIRRIRRCQRCVVYCGDGRPCQPWVFHYFYHDRGRLSVHLTFVREISGVNRMEEPVLEIKTPGLPPLLCNRKSTDVHRSCFRQRYHSLRTYGCGASPAD